MPKGASEIVRRLFLRVLILGAPKAGKSVAAITTAPRPVLVINGDQKEALASAIRLWVRKDGGRGAISGDEFDVETVKSILGMERALEAAKVGVRKGRYKSIVFDLLSGYADRLVEELAAKTDSGEGPDGRRYWPEFHKRLKNTLLRLFALDAHVIVTSHFDDDEGALIDGQTAKTGTGIVPLLPGRSRRTVGGLFQDVVFLEKRGKKRVFLTDIDGVWGPGCRSLSGSKEKVLPARIDALIEAFGIKGGGEAPRSNIERRAQEKQLRKIKA